MASIRFAFLSELNEVKVPLPHKLRVFLKESICENFGRICDSAIALLPEPVIASKGWDSTGCTQPSPCHHYYILFADNEFCRLLRCAFLRLMSIAIR